MTNKQLVKTNRTIISKSSVYESISENVGMDLSLMNKERFINLKDINDVLGEIQMRNLPLTPFIIKELENRRIILSTSEKVGSSIQLVPSVNDNGDIKVIIVNTSSFMKKKKDVDMETGDIIERYTCDFESLYNVLLGAYVALNTESVFKSYSVTKQISEIYTDMMAQVISRGFGNPMDGDKLRFLIKLYFHNGLIDGEELANLEGYNIDAARFMASKYPDFFSHEAKTLDDLVSVISSEFTTIKGLTLNSLIVECVKAFGSNALLAVENNPYLLSVMVVKMRKDRSGVYNGYILRLIDPFARKLLSEILREIS